MKKQIQVSESAANTTGKKKPDPAHKEGY